MIQPANRLNKTSLQFFASINEKIRQLRDAGHDVIRLDIGSPDLPPADHIIKALSDSAQKKNSHGYQPHSGSPAYVRAWSQWYTNQYGIELDDEREIIPLLGSKEGIFHLMQALINPGDVVLIPDPGYLTYTQATYINDGEPYYLPLTSSNAYLPDLSLIPDEVASRARLLWLNYPNNPTAAVAPYSFFERVVDFAKSNNILICHDAAYNFVTFDGYIAPSILQVPGAKNVAVEFHTLSKSHNMAGWRVGAAIGNPAAMRALYLVKTNADSGHFLPIHEGAKAALLGDQSWLTDRNLIYRNRRDIVVSALRNIGLTVETPRASIYVWVPIPPGWKSGDFAVELLNNVHVSVAPGIIFGLSSDNYMRFALTEPTERIEQAMLRISKYFG